MELLESRRRKRREARKIHLFCHFSPQRILRLSHWRDGDWSTCSHPAATSGAPELSGADSRGGASGPFSEACFVLAGHSSTLLWLRTANSSEMQGLHHHFSRKDSDRKSETPFRPKFKLAKWVVNCHSLKIQTKSTYVTGDTIAGWCRFHPTTLISGPISMTRPKMDHVVADHKICILKEALYFVGMMRS